MVRATHARHSIVGHEAADISPQAHPSSVDFPVYRIEKYSVDLYMSKGGASVDK